MSCTRCCWVCSMVVVRMVVMTRSYVTRVLGIRRQARVICQSNTESDSERNDDDDHDDGDKSPEKFTTRSSSS